MLKKCRLTEYKTISEDIPTCGVLQSVRGCKSWTVGIAKYKKTRKF